MAIRKFQSEDAKEMAQVIAGTLEVSNSRDYSKENIEAIIVSHSAEIISEKSV